MKTSIVVAEFPSKSWPVIMSH